MGTTTVAARTGRINGLRRETPMPGRRLRMHRRAHSPMILAGSGLYAVALLFPLLLKQVTPPVFAAALLGTGLILAGLHVRWSSPAVR